MAPAGVSTAAVFSRKTPILTAPPSMRKVAASTQRSGRHLASRFGTLLPVMYQQTSGPAAPIPALGALPKPTLPVATLMRSSTT